MRAIAYPSQSYTQWTCLINAGGGDYIDAIGTPWHKLQQKNLPTMRGTYTVVGIVECC